MDHTGDRGTISASPRPVCTSGKPELPSKHSRALKPDGRMSRTAAEQRKPRGTEGLSASESLMLKIRRVQSCGQILIVGRCPPTTTPW